VLLEVTSNDAMQMIREGGSLALLIFVVVGGMRGVYIWRWVYDKLEKDRDEWKRIALSSTTLADRAVEIAVREPK